MAASMPMQPHTGPAPPSLTDQFLSQFLSSFSSIRQWTKSHRRTQHLVASYEHEARKKVRSAFYVAHVILVKYNVEGTPKLPTPSLLPEALSGCAFVFAPFGGQGIHEVYFDGLQSETLFDTSPIR